MATEFVSVEAAEKELQSVTNRLQQLKQQNLFRIRDLLNTYERQDTTTSLKESGVQRIVKKEVHPTGAHKTFTPSDRILICYYQATGENAANVLKTQLTSTAPCELLAVSNAIDWDENTIEAQVADSTAVIAILSKSALAQSALAFVLECLLQYDSVRPILVHDAATCYFPGPSEIPPIAMPLFGEKAVTFLADYHEAVVEQIVKRYQEQKHAMANFSIQRSHHDEPDATLEDVHTRLFLSHRRATAQAIAGKMYEGFKRFYSVFLDSETQFKIHNLEYIVSKTDVFVWILSDGYLTSEWCTKELYAALKNNVRVIIVRDANYKVPENLRSWQDLVTQQQIADLIANAPTLVWMAEYNQQCVDKIRELYLGATDEVVAEIPKWVSQKPLLQAGFDAKLFDRNAPLNTTDWKYSLSDLLVGLTFNYGCKITCLDLSSIAKDEMLEDLKSLPLTHLILRNSTVTDNGLSKLGNLCPNLIYLDINDCKNHRTPSLSGLFQLEYLDVSGCNNLNLESYRPIIHDLRNLRHLQASDTFFDQVSLSMFVYYCPNLKYVCANKSIHLEDKVLEFVHKYNPNFEYQGWSQHVPEEYQIKGEDERYYGSGSEYEEEEEEEDEVAELCQDIKNMGEEWGPEMKDMAIAGLKELYEKMKETVNGVVKVTSNGKWDDDWVLPVLGCGAATFETNADTDFYVFLSASIYSLEESYQIIISGWGDSKTVVQSPAGGNTLVEIDLSEHPEAGLKEPGWKQFWVKLQDGEISLGRGKVVGENEVLRGKGETPFEVEYLGFGVCEKTQHVRNVEIVELAERENQDSKAEEDDE